MPLNFGEFENLEYMSKEQAEIEVIEPTEEIEVETESTEVDAEEASDESVVVSIDGVTPTQTEDEEQPAPSWVKELRKSHRELQKQNRELQAKLQSPVQAEKPVLGKKPTLEDSDFDTDKFETELEKWHEKKRTLAESQRQAEQAEQAQRTTWQEKLNHYGKAKAELKVKDFDEAEENVKELFDTTQQGILLHGSESPALLVYALGKNRKIAEELASIKDGVKLSFALAKLEARLKITKPKPATPPPEKSVQSNARISGSVDSTLERLREKAAKTGDFTEVYRYKQTKR